MIKSVKEKFMTKELYQKLSNMNHDYINLLQIPNKETAEIDFVFITAGGGPFNPNLPIDEWEKILHGKTLKEICDISISKIKKLDKRALESRIMDLADQIFILNHELKSREITTKERTQKKSLRKELYKKLAQEEDKRSELHFWESELEKAAIHIGWGNDKKDENKTWEEIKQQEKLEEANRKNILQQSKTPDKSKDGKQ